MARAEDFTHVNHELNRIDRILSNDTPNSIVADLPKYCGRSRKRQFDHPVVAFELQSTC